MQWRVMPIRVWPGQKTERPRRHPFRRSSGLYMDRGVDWRATVDLLERELNHLRASEVILQMFVSDKDIRLDGWIRANASPSSPGVVLTFETPKYGTLNYPCDTFSDWQANVRAIAIGLEDLRRLARYGIAANGQQYTGWKALPERSSFDGYAVLAHWAGMAVEGARKDPAAAYKAARRTAHPDAGGTPEAFHDVQEAARILGVA